MSWWRFWKKITDPEPLKIWREPVVNESGIRLIKASEGYSATPYMCQANVWTIGFGSTVDKNYHSVTKNHPQIDVDYANDLFYRDIKVFSRSVLSDVKVLINDNQLSALTSLAYNIGQGAFRASTLLRKLNRGDFDGCSNEFWRWRRANGEISAGLVKRRKLERNLFMS